MPIGWKGFDLSYNLYEKKSYQYGQQFQVQTVDKVFERF